MMLRVRKVVLPAAAVVALGACTAAGTGAPAAADTHASVAPAPTAASSSSAVVVLNAADPRERRCPIEQGKAFTSQVEVANGKGFWEVFPKAGLAPEMSDAAGPVFLAVYPDGFRGPMAQLPGSEPRKAGPATGTVDVCAIFQDGSRVIYGDIPVEGSSVIK